MKQIETYQVYTLSHSESISDSSLVIFIEKLYIMDANIGTYACTNKTLLVDIL